ncbi:MAG: hypothetical protein JWN99_2569, partial [Ilumatobacteraceae bacterium]|nr:hypothetical protein [Ilumatobacteraceae bacterium]
MERLEVDRASAAHATAVHRNPWTLVFRGLGHDLVTLARRFRSAVIARRFRSFALAIATAMLIIVFEVAKQTAGGARLVRTVAGVHQSDHLVVLLLRTPLSIFAAAPSLPVWGAIVQVLVVISIAQQILGWRRVVIIAVGSQFLINVVTHATVISGHPGWMGVAGQVFDLDTGPSVVVVALACAGALEAPARWLGTLMVIGLAIELVLTPDAAAHEHMLAVFAGVVLWWVTRAGDEHLGLPALEAVAASQRQRHRRAVRRSASATIAVAGIGAILSALAAPRSGRVHPSVLTDLPVGAQHAANGVVAAGGVALLVLSRGLLRGQRRAWTFSVVLVGMLAMGYLVKGGGLQEASLSVGGLVVLLAAHDSFRAGTDRGSGRFALRSAAGMLLVGFAGAFVAIEAFTAYSAKRPRLPPGAAARTILESLFGWHANDVTVRTAGFLHAGVFGASATVALVCLWRALRPVLARDHALGDRRMEQQRARQLVDRYGGGTLDYFILRDDKSLFFSGDTVVGYTVRFGVCVVSPDPIGPVSQRTAAWGDFRAFTDRQGWTMSVLAASDDWLATYRGFGMTTIYAGDEAVVDTQTFDLGGGDRKSLRQAVNRIARHGYCVTFHDPTTVSPQLRESIESLMHSSRRGGVER